MRWGSGRTIALFVAAIKNGLIVSRDSRARAHAILSTRYTGSEAHTAVARAYQEGKKRGTLSCLSMGYIHIASPVM